MGQKRAVLTSSVLFDEGVTEAALHLTDPTVQTIEQVAEIFQKVARGRPQVNANDGGVNWTADGLGRFDIFDWESARRLLFRWCPRISQYDRLSKTSRSALLAEINQAAHAFGMVNLRVTSAGLSLETEWDSVGYAAFRAILPFLQPKYGWPPRRLGKCQLNTCGRWFLRPNKAGTVAMYCSTKHSNLARVRRSRSK